MVVIIGGSTFGALSGSIGAANFYQFRGRQVLRHKPIPTNRRTPRQVEARVRFSRSLKAWRDRDFSEDEQKYADWGKSSVFRSRGLTYPIRDYQFFLGYHSNYLLNSNLPAEPTSQPAERPKTPVCRPFYDPDQDKIFLVFDVYVYGTHYIHVWSTDHFHLWNKVLPRRFAYFEANTSIFDVLANLQGQFCMNDDAATTTVHDRSVNLSHFTFSDAIGDPNTDAHSILGKCNKALDFDGVDDYASRVYEDALDLAYPHSFCCWIYLDTLGAARSAMYCVRNTVSPNRTGLDFCVHNIGRLQLRIWNGANSAIYGDARTLNPNTWYHVGYTLASGCKLHFYVDGVASAETACAFMPADPSGETMNIGAMSPAFEDLNGKLDDLRFYNIVLTPQQIYSIYHFTPNHEHIAPIVLDPGINYISGKYQSWFKYRLLKSGGGWSPKESTYFRHEF